MWQIAFLEKIILSEINRALNDGATIEHANLTIEYQHHNIRHEAIEHHYAVEQNLVEEIPHEDGIVVNERTVGAYLLQKFRGYYCKIARVQIRKDNTEGIEIGEMEAYFFLRSICLETRTLILQLLSEIECQTTPIRILSADAIFLINRRCEEDETIYISCVNNRIQTFRAENRARIERQKNIGKQTIGRSAS